MDHEDFEKYTTSCLRLIMTDEVARHYSWCGQNNNIKLSEYHIIKILIGISHFNVVTQEKNVLIDYCYTLQII